MHLRVFFLHCEDMYIAKHTILKKKVKEYDEDFIPT